MAGRVPLRLALAALAFAAAALAGPAPSAAQSTVNPPEDAVEAPQPPPPAEMWGKVREGATGRSSVPGPGAARLIHAEGQVWRNRNNGLVKTAGLVVLGVTLAGLGAYLFVRGRIRMDGKPTGKTVERFGHWARMGHWLAGLSFIVLALSGFAITYGRLALRPVLDPATFAILLRVAKVVHDFVGFAFVAGVAVMIVYWVRHALPERTDATWLARAGGLFGGQGYPPAGMLNAGQKLMFWLVVLGGAAMAVSGLSLLFPFVLTDVYAMQAMQLLHVGLAVALSAAVLVHVYFGTLGTQGAFRAAATGHVDREWAKTHHSTWFSEVRKAERAAAKAAREAKAETKDASAAPPAQEDPADDTPRKPSGGGRPAEKARQPGGAGRTGSPSAGAPEGAKFASGERGGGEGTS